jgi:hypothetical protein
MLALKKIGAFSETTIDDFSFCFLTNIFIALAKHKDCTLEDSEGPLGAETGHRTKEICSFAEIWLALMLTLICCETKTLFVH